jgi:hypothetical protein
MRNPSGARLSPDPLGLHAESLGDLFSCQKPVHGRSSSRWARSPRQSTAADVRTAARCRVLTAHCSAAGDGSGDERAFGVHMIGRSEVAPRSKYWNGKVESLLQRSIGDPAVPPDRPGRMGTSRYGAVPSSRRAELRSTSTVSSAPPRRERSAGRRRRGYARAHGGERGSGSARRTAAPHGRRAGPLRSPLAVARPPQPGRRSVGGRSPAGARVPPGGGVATASLAGLARSGGHRLGGDRPDRRRHSDRDKDQHLRRASCRPGTRAGGMAVPPPAKVVPPRRSSSTVPRSSSWSAAV